MTSFEIDEVTTLVIGVVALFVGRWIRQSVPFPRWFALEAGVSPRSHSDLGKRTL